MSEFKVELRIHQEKTVLLDQTVLRNNYPAALKSTINTLTLQLEEHEKEIAERDAKYGVTRT